MDYSTQSKKDDTWALFNKTKCSIIKDGYLFGYKIFTIKTC